MPWRNDATPRNTMKPNGVKVTNLDGKAGVLHGAHMGGHSDVANPQTKTTVNNIMKAKLAEKPSAAELTSQYKKTMSDALNKQTPTLKQFEAKIRSGK